MKQYKRVNESVIETKTSNTIYVGQRSKEITNHLNGGGAFNGFTPGFFLNRLK